MTIRTPHIRMRGIRQKMPTGYIVGRVNPGDGEAELIPIDQFGKHLVETGTVAGGVTPPGGGSSNAQYEFLGFSGTGLFTSLQRFDMAMSPRKVLFPSVLGASHSQATAGFAPASTYVFHLVTDYSQFLANGSTVLATVTFTAGSKTGTIAWGTPVIVAQGQVLYLIMQNATDATFGEVQVLFAGDAQ